MADLTVTAANVVPVAGYTYVDLVAGEALTAGQLVYQSSTDQKAYKADCDSATTMVRSIKGVALSGVAASQPVRVMTGGDYNPGATVVVGTIYCLSDVAGAIRPATDNATGDYVSILGVATTASNIKLSIFNSTVAVP